MKQTIASNRGRVFQNVQTLALGRRSSPWRLVTGHSMIRRQCSVRHISTSNTRRKAPFSVADDQKRIDVTAGNHHNGPNHQPLSLLPLRMILRSLMTSTVSSSPKLLAIFLPILRFLAYNETKIFNPDHNILLKYILNKSLYEQFCAGQDAEEVSKTVTGVKDIGFTGAILAYARESPTEITKDESKKSQTQSDADGKTDRDISEWLDNSLQTVRLAKAGDFIALK